MARVRRDAVPGPGGSETRPYEEGGVGVRGMEVRRMETRGTADQTDGGQRTGRRRSIRLKGYDYAESGAYFVTVCTQNRACLFGDVVDGEMLLSDAGRIVQTVWEALPNHYPHADLDAWIIMPNHVHAVIVLGPA